MEKFTHISFERTDGFGYVTLLRPEVHNAIDDIMISELTRLFTDLENDMELRAVVIRGSGASFSSGADLNYMRSLVNFSKNDNLDDAVRMASMFDVIYYCPVPVITVIHGNVFGGANGLVAVSDIAICADDTVFRFSELKLGLVPATVSPYVMRRIGESHAAELFFTSRTFTGAEAYSYGLVNRSVKPGDLEKELNSVLEGMKSSGTLALRKAKHLIRAVSGKEIDSEIRRLTSRLIAEIRVSPEAQEGMMAFIEKRKPGWVK
jgi:methylglutaconyl-CoA hydratase